MTELEQQLLTALEQMQTEQKAQKNALRQMFEYQTRQSGVTRAIEDIFRQAEDDRTTEERGLAELGTACKQLDRASTELRTASQTIEEVRQTERGGRYR